jgi:cell wall-associated NlpC family hydrolase
MKTRTMAAAALVGALLAGPSAVASALTAGPRLPACAGCHGPGDGNAVVRQARRYLGVPYLWGGTDPATGLDCSGFTQRVYADLGKQLPRTAAEQQHAGTPVHGLSNARPGDLLFWDYGDGDHHVAIYEGSGRLIEAPQPGMTVSERNVYSGVVAIRRITT